MRLRTKHVLWGVVGWLLTALCAFGQTASGTISGQVFTMQGRPAAFAPVRVCANTSTGTPCTPTSDIYSDSGLTHALPNPTTTDQYGNYSIFVAVGVYIVQITPSAGTTYNYLVSVASGSGGGGGNIQPTPQYRIFQQPTAGTQQIAGPTNLATDSTGNSLTVPRIFTGQITNGGLNSDTYATGSGNNGVANAIASSDCTGGCLIGRPQTSTDSENIPGLLYNKGEYLHALDSEYGAAGHFFFNAGQNLSGIHERDAKPTTCFWNDALNELNNNLNCDPLYSTYNSPGRYGQGATAVSKAHTTNFSAYATGIAQLYGATFNMLSTGDKALQYFYGYYRGGEVQGADEGTEGIYTGLGEANNPYGSVFTGGTGAQTLQLTAVAFSGNLAAGQNLLDVQTAEASGLIVSQAVGSANLPNTATTSDTHAVNTGYGVTTASCGTYTARNNPASSTCTLTGVTGAFVTGPACVGDYKNYEQIKITAATSTTITAGFSYVHPAGVTIEQGGLCGDYVVMGNGSTSIAAPYHLTSYSIVGSPTATTFDYVVEDNAGQNGKVQMPITSMPTESILGTITRASNIVSIVNPAPNSAFAYNGYIAPSGAAITISGATPSDLNGTVTAPAVTPTSMSWSQTGADETGSGGTISVAGLNNYFAYCGAETTFVTVQLNSASQPIPNNNVTVEPNHCAWASGDEVAQPNHYSIGVIAHRTILSGFSPGLPGGNFTAHQLQVSGQSYAGRYLNAIQDSDPISSYAGYGGTWQPHRYLQSNDVYDNMFNLKYAPANGGTIFAIGCDPLGCSSTNYDYPLFQLTGVGGSSYLEFSPAHNWLYAGNAGLLSGSYMGANGAIGLSGKPGQAFVAPGTSAPNVAYLSSLGATNTTAVLGTGTQGDSSGTLGAKTLAAPNVIAGASAPTNFTVTPNTSGTTTYTYACTAVTQYGESTAGTGTTTAGPATLSASAYNNILCSGVPGAQSLNIYRTSGGATQGKIANVANGNADNISVGAFRDTGLAGDGTSPPGTNNTGSFTGYGSTSNFTISGSPICTMASGCGGSMVYPGAGVAVSTGSAWGSSIAAANIPLLNASNTFTGSIQTVPNLVATDTAEFGPIVGSSHQVVINPAVSITGYDASDDVMYSFSNTDGSGVFAGLVKLSSLQISGITGSTQCLEVDTTGLVSGTSCSGGGFITSLTTTGTSGAAAVTSGVLNIPNYTYTLPQATTSVLGGVKPDGTTCTTSAGVLTCPGSGGISGLTAGFVPVATSGTSIGNSLLDYGVTTASTFTFGAPVAFNDGSGQGGGFNGTEGTAISGSSGHDALWADSTDHRLKMNNNNGGATDVVGFSDQASASLYGVVKVDGTTITATGGVISAVGGGGVTNSTATVGTTAIAANTCTSASTITMTGVTTAMVINFTPSSDISAVTGWGSSGGLDIVAWPTTNTVNYKVCNATAASITPSSSVTFNVGAR